MLIKSLLYCHEVQYPRKVLERQTRSLKNRFQVSNFKRKWVTYFLRTLTYSRSEKRLHRVGIASFGFWRDNCGYPKLQVKIGRMGYGWFSGCRVLSCCCYFIHTSCLIHHDRENDMPLDILEWWLKLAPLRNQRCLFLLPQSLQRCSNFDKEPRSLLPSEKWHSRATRVVRTSTSNVLAMATN